MCDSVDDPVFPRQTRHIKQVLVYFKKTKTLRTSVRIPLNGFIISFGKCERNQ